MSTTANIIFASNYYTNDSECLDKYVSQDLDYVKNGNQIYIHFDGYPENIINVLSKFFKSYGSKVRRLDNNYLSAWFVTFYCMNNKVNYLRKDVNWDYFNYMDYFIPTVEDIFNIVDFSGVGLHNGEESDTNYTYVITNRDITSSNVWVYNINKEFIELISLDIKE